MPTTFSDWRDLPFREIWVEDTEYYPGPGLANGGQDGDQITPLCLAALEMRSGRIVRRWQDGLGPFPPFRLDADAIVCTYMATAEAGFHLAQGWGQPAGVIDAYVEFRHLTNDGRVKSGDRPKGYYSLAGALRFFGEDELDTGHKTEMRDRILQGPPFTAQEREAIIEYCCDDVRALARLVTRLVPRISSLEHALFRGQYSWLLAHQERRGIPIDLPRLTRIREHWDTIKTELVTTIDSRFGCYEIIDGVPHFRDERFRSYLQREGITLADLR